MEKGFGDFSTVTYARVGTNAMQYGGPHQEKDKKQNIKKCNFSTNTPIT